MEVAQIARGIVLDLLGQTGRPTKLPTGLLLDDLAEAVGFAHDLGHPPFGHGGETGLNYALRDDGGFEGNGQSLRLVARLEPHTPGHGLDLTRRALLGILKYPAPYSRVTRSQRAEATDARHVPNPSEWRPPKCYLDEEQDVVDWILEPLSRADRDAFTALSIDPSPTRHGKIVHKSLDASIVEVADDIAYGVHDLEDGIALGLIDAEDWDRVRDDLDPSWASQYEGLGDADEFKRQLFGRSGSSPDEGPPYPDRKRAVGTLVHAFITSTDVKRLGTFEEPLLDAQVYLSPPARVFLDRLQWLVRVMIIDRQTVQTAEYRARFIVASLFEALCSDPHRLLNEELGQRLATAIDQRSRTRVIADYLAGMTDSYAERMYNRLFVPGHGSVFDRL
jgi:dGTPase